MMQVKIFQFNPVGENTFVLYDDMKECVIIDPGCFTEAEEEKLANFIESNDLTVKHLLCTHLHFDHVFGVNFVSNKYNVPLEASKEDEILLTTYEEQLRMFGFPDDGNSAPSIGRYLREGDKIYFGNQVLNIMTVPGHSPGSLVFYNSVSHDLFVGDVLFHESIGRTDLIGGNHKQLIEGIKSKLLTLPPETKVYSGHGPATTIGREKSSNMFLR